MELFGLFSIALLAATILPAQSEAVLVALVMHHHHSVWMLVVVASAGNILGSCINWWLGKGIATWQGRKWFPVSAAGLRRAETYFQRFGVWSLLFAWLPMIGDALTVAAGVLRTPLRVFLPLVALGKIARYVAVVAMIPQ